MNGPESIEKSEIRFDINFQKYLYVGAVHLSLKIVSHDVLEHVTIVISVVVVTSS